MKELIKNGDIILDGTAPRYAKEKEAFLLLEQLTNCCNKHRVETLEELEGLLQTAEKYIASEDTKDNYYIKLRLVIKKTELFDQQGKIFFINNIVKEAILHAEQFNDSKRFANIKKDMWEEVIKEQNWNFNPDSYEENCKFIAIKVPKRCAPITYRR